MYICIYKNMDVILLVSRSNRYHSKLDNTRNANNGFRNIVDLILECQPQVNYTEQHLNENIFPINGYNKPLFGFQFQIGLDTITYDQKKHNFCVKKQCWTVREGFLDRLHISDDMNHTNSPFRIYQGNYSKFEENSDSIEENSDSSEYNVDSIEENVYLWYEFGCDNLKIENNHIYLFGSRPLRLRRLDYIMGATVLFTCVHYILQLNKQFKKYTSVACAAPCFLLKKLIEKNDPMVRGHITKTVNYLKNEQDQCVWYTFYFKPYIYNFLNMRIREIRDGELKVVQSTTQGGEFYFCLEDKDDKANRNEIINLFFEWIDRCMNRYYYRLIILKTYSSSECRDEVYKLINS